MPHLARKNVYIEIITGEAPVRRAAGQARCSAAYADDAEWGPEQRGNAGRTRQSRTKPAVDEAGSQMLREAAAEVGAEDACGQSQSSSSTSSGQSSRTSSSSTSSSSSSSSSSGTTSDDSSSKPDSVKEPKVEEDKDKEEDHGQEQKAKRRRLIGASQQFGIHRLTPRQQGGCVNGWQATCSFHPSEPKCTKTVTDVRYSSELQQRMCMTWLLWGNGLPHKEAHRLEENPVIHLQNWSLS